MGDPHVSHRFGWSFILDHFVVVCRDQSVERVAHEAEAEMAAPVLARLTQGDQLRLLIGFMLPEFIGCCFCSFGWHFAQ